MRAAGQEGAGLGERGTASALLIRYQSNPMRHPVTANYDQQ